MSANYSKKIPIYSGERLVDFCDAARAEKLCGGVNVTVTRRRGGAIMRITLAVVEARDEEHVGGNDLSLTYRETLGGHAVTILKRYESETGRFVAWSDRDSFNPRRFNPDLVAGR